MGNAEPAAPRPGGWDIRLVQRQGLKAALYLASGGRLCSQVLGEGTNSGQVKEADAWAQECQTSGPVLSRLFAALLRPANASVQKCLLAQWEVRWRPRQWIKPLKLVIQEGGPGGGER